MPLDVSSKRLMKCGAVDKPEVGMPTSGLSEGGEVAGDCR